MENMYNLLEFGGKGSLIATAITDFTVNKKDYKKNEIVFVLNDVNINFHYGEKVNNIKDSRNRVYYSEYYLDSFMVDAVPFDLQIFNLFSNGVNIREESILICDSCTATSGIIIPKEEVDINGFIKIDSIDNFLINSNNGVSIISSSEFVDGKTYKIQYYTKKNIFSFVLDNEDLNIPYLKIQINFKGNESKNTSSNYFIIDKTSIRMTPIFNLVDNSVSSVRLLFKVIESDVKPELWLC